MNQIERDILLRSFKHIFNEILRESQMQYCSDIVSHLLNCILGGEELVKALNNWKIKPESATFPEIAKVEKAEESTDGSKDKKKKSKKDQKKGKGGKDVKEDGDKDEEEFKFKVTRFFNESYNALIENRKIELCKGLNLTSEQLYSKIKNIALHRYEHKLPENVWQLECLQTKS